jgi:hypothetical protein
MDQRTRTLLLAIYGTKAAAGVIVLAVLLIYHFWG